MGDENITILILNSVKKIRGIKVNRRRIRFAIYSGVILIIFFASSIGANFYLFNQYKDVSDQLASLQNIETQRQATLGTDSDDGANENGEDALTNGTNGTLDGTNGSQPAAEEPAPIEVEDIFANDKNSESIALQNVNYQVGMNGMELEVDLGLLNKLRNDEIVSGYVLIVAKTTYKKQPYVSWPIVTLNDQGMAEDFRSGEKFSMRRFTQKGGRMLADDAASSFLYFRVFVYSSGGQLLLQKSMHISDTD